MLVGGGFSGTLVIAIAVVSLCASFDGATVMSSRQFFVVVTVEEKGCKRRRNMGLCLCLHNIVFTLKKKNNRTHVIPLNQ